MKYLNGRNVVIYADNQIIAACKSCSIMVDYDLIEYSSPDSSRAKDFLAGRYTWAITLNGLVPNGGFTSYVMRAGKKYHIKVKQVDRIKGVLIDPMNDYLEGDAICTSTNVDFANNSLAKGSIKLQGTGELDNIEVFLPVRPMPLQEGDE